MGRNFGSHCQKALSNPDLDNTTTLVKYTLWIGKGYGKIFWVDIRSQSIAAPSAMKWTQHTRVGSFPYTTNERGLRAECIECHEDVGHQR